MTNQVGINNINILNLLQLASPTLPVGAYSYSEGLESLVNDGIITNLIQLENWLTDNLKFGSIQMEAAIMVRAYLAINQQNFSQLIYWQNWADATRDTAELRQQSLQMGRSLIKLFLNLSTSPAKLLNIDQDLESNIIDQVRHQIETDNHFCHWAIAYGITAACWQIDLNTAILGYLHSWLTNLINAGVKLIPLGQTDGQKLLWSMQPAIYQTTQSILELTDDDLVTCNWGLSLA
ncbi:MAG: urease accessory protein UreF, partial [Microcoleaceae cyanobacterium]